MVLFFVILFSSCKQEKEKPKVIYEGPSKVESQSKKDTARVTIVGLPIQMEGTNFLLFPVGELNSSEKGLDSYSGSSQMNYKVSNYSEYQITGYIRNLKFQRVGQDSISNLTDKNILIQSITYLKTIGDKTKQHILVYELEDMDTNKDVKLDDNDIKSLYLSDISGGRFTKLSMDFHELIDWKVVETVNRLYYRTSEDTNKNGAFDNNDKFHYFYVDLSGKEWQPIEYNPL